MCAVHSGRTTVSIIYEEYNKRKGAHLECAVTALAPPVF